MQRQAPCKGTEVWFDRELTRCQHLLGGAQFLRAIVDLIDQATAHQRSIAA
jgi:hypothetical protein